MPTTSNFGWTTPADTDLVKDGALAIRTLGNGIDTSMMDLKGGTTGQILSKASNSDMDFTWIANDTGDITGITAGTGISGGGTSGTVTITNSMATEITAAGDIIIGTGSGTFDNLPIGTTGQVLTADTTVSPYKVKWATASSGGLVFITGTTFSAVSSVSLPADTFSSSYRNYRVIFTVNSAATTGDMTLRMRSAGSDNTTSAYSQATVGIDRSGTASNVGQNNQSSLNIGKVDGTYFNYAFVVDFIEPKISQEFHPILGNLMYWADSTYVGRSFHGAFVTASSSFDSASFIKSAGTMSGIYRVYGYN